MNVPSELRDKIVTPGDPAYRLVRSTYTTTGRPTAVLQPTTTGEVVAALGFAREQGLPLAVRSGGHGLSGRSTVDGGIVIDLSAMNRVEVVDPGRRIVRVEAGARWANVAAAIEPYGLAISSGDHGNVGAGGLATAAGIGWLGRHYGLTIDHIRAVELVLADGTTLRADEENEADLFWAVRGAGGGVGIVTAFEIEAMELRDVGYAEIVLEAARDGSTLRRWHDHLATAPRELTTIMHLFPNGGGLAASITAVVADHDPDRVTAALTPLLRLGKPLRQSAQLVPYTGLVSTRHLHANTGQMLAVTTNGLLSAMTHDSAGAIMAMARQGVLVQLRSVGGAINDIEPDATAYAHRHQHTLVVASTFPPRGAAELDAAWNRLRPHADGAYVNFESRPDRRTFAHAYPGDTGRRVAELWAKYDPEELFTPSENG